MTKECPRCGNYCADSASICLKCHHQFGRCGYDKGPKLVGCGTCGGTETTPGRGYIPRSDPLGIKEALGERLRMKCPNPRCNGGWVRV
ncbi:MAG: hypothetical protein Q7J35_13875 [Candidatus Methanoperedens sp.]|nr:hypothetical protein [Candidatus Methanoperedens sp.]